MVGGAVDRGGAWIFLRDETNEGSGKALVGARLKASEHRQSVDH